MQIPSDRKFQYKGEWWILEKATDTELTFKVAPQIGGMAGNFLKRWRRQKKDQRGKIMTQAAAAKYFNVSQATIAKIETGKRSLSVKMFRQISKDFRANGRYTIPFD